MRDGAAQSASYLMISTRFAPTAPPTATATHLLLRLLRLLLLLLTSAKQVRGGRRGSAKQLGRGCRGGAKQLGGSGRGGAKQIRRGRWRRAKQVGRGRWASAKQLGGGGRASAEQVSRSRWCRWRRRKAAAAAAAATVARWLGAKACLRRAVHCAATEEVRGHRLQRGLLLLLLLLLLGGLRRGGLRLGLRAEEVACCGRIFAEQGGHRGWLHRGCLGANLRGDGGQPPVFAKGLPPGYPEWWGPERRGFWVNGGRGRRAHRQGRSTGVCGGHACG